MFAQDFGCFHYDIDWDPQATEWDFRGLNDLTAEPNNLAPSEDFWKKFEEMPDFPPDLNEDLESLFGVDTGEMDLSSVIMNHDCMWSGTCLNKDHKPENKPPPPPPPVSLADSNPSSPVLSTTNDEPSMPAPKTPPKIVRKRPTGVHTFGSRTTATVKREEPPRPDTPPSLSESEEDELSTKQRSNSETPLSTMQHSTTAHIRRTIQTSAFDHNYDKSVRPEDYGLQTPSDSEEPNQSSASEEEEEDEEEEEIDVVSLSRDTLPTNPTREIRSQLQRKVASAISTNSLLNAKRAVSRRLKQTKKAKRKRTSSDEDEADDYDEIVVDNTRITAAVSSAGSSSSYYLPAVNNHNHHSIGHNVLVAGHHQIGASTTTATSVGRRNWRKNAKKGRFSDSEPDSERRSIHNNMERMRRIDLRNAFDDLKTLLPSLADAQRAPKVTILKDATSYLHELRQKEKTLAQHVSKLRSHQEELRSTLSRLRKNLAAIR